MKYELTAKFVVEAVTPEDASEALQNALSYMPEVSNDCASIESFHVGPDFAALDEPTVEELETLRAFAFAYGADWKDKLSAAWASGKDTSFPNGYLLRALRNRLGPEWLEGFVL